MAVLVLWGADTEFQPCCSEDQQLEPSTEYLFGIFPLWVEGYVGGLNSSCLLRVSDRCGNWTHKYQMWLSIKLDIDNLLANAPKDAV